MVPGWQASETAIGLSLVLGAAVCSAFRWTWMEMLLRPAALEASEMQSFGDTAATDAEPERAEEEREGALKPL
eukprot:5900248-Prymnesium_polylepis.1